MDHSTSPFESRDAITNFLFIRDEPQKVDLCFVLGCPAVSNMDPAIDLYKKKFTDKILVSGLGPTGSEVPEAEIFRDYAVERGVPQSVISTEIKAKNTYENFVYSAEIIGNLLGWNQIQTVAIVCKPFHARRALMTARKNWPNRLRLIMLPSNEPGDPLAENWWETDSGARFILHELRAIGQYAIDGHVGGIS